VFIVTLPVKQKFNKSCDVIMGSHMEAEGTFMGSICEDGRQKNSCWVQIPPEMQSVDLK
jgi:hypothetical protein